MRQSGNSAGTKDAVRGGRKDVVGCCMPALRAHLPCPVLLPGVVAHRCVYARVVSSECRLPSSACLQYYFAPSGKRFRSRTEVCLRSCC